MSSSQNLKETYIIGKNKKQIFYYRNVIFMNEETAKLIFGEKHKNNLIKTKCLLGNKHMFVFMEYKFKTIIELGSINNDDCLYKVEIIINLNKEEQIIDKIKAISYYEFYSILNLPNMNEANTAPFYNEQKEIIGEVYKLQSNKEYYSNECYNQLLRKIIYLIFYFEKFKYSIITNTKLDIEQNLKKGKIDRFYLINENYIKNIKENYQWENIKKNINKIGIGQQTLKLVQNDMEKFLEKKVLLIQQRMPELNKFYNENNNNNDNEFQIEEPDLDLLLLYGKNFYFYVNFFLLKSEIYDILFELDEKQSINMKNKNSYLQCFFVEGYSFVILKKESTQINNYYILEVGEIDNDNKFNLKYFLLYNTKEDFYKHFRLLSNKGIKNFFQSLNFKDSNFFLDLNDSNGQKIGEVRQYIVNNGENINDISNNSSKQTIDQSIDNYIPIKQKFYEPPKIGLQNVGATCYMNATLQCLCQIEKLADYFKSEEKIDYKIREYKMKNEDCLTYSFKNLIENVWPTNEKYLKKKYTGQNSKNKYFIPKEFKEKISIMNPLFQGVKANDSKDLVNFIIMRLHEELNEGEKIKNNNYGVPSQEDEIGSYNFFNNSFFTENNSIISKIFYGTLGTKYECSKCHIKKFNYQSAFFYIFPLEEIRKYKINIEKEKCIQNMQQQMAMMQMQMGQNMFMFNNMNNYNAQIMCQPYLTQIENINSVNIYECFDYYQKIEIMSGDNAMHCNNCKSQEAALYQTYIVNSPDIIIIILNRGKGIEFNVKLEFTELLNLQCYVKNYNGLSSYYKLIGVVTHLGESGASGHFIAYCRSPINNTWYQYNDELCNDVNNFKKDVIDYAMPYILFYQIQ